MENITAEQIRMLSIIVVILLSILLSVIFLRDYKDEGLSENELFLTRLLYTIFIATTLTLLFFAFLIILINVLNAWWNTAIGLLRLTYE